jgi:hypothetical protein
MSLSCAGIADNTEESIEKFRKPLYELFLGQNTDITKAYLRLLLDRIIVEGRSIKLMDKTTSHASLLVNGEAVNQKETVLAVASDWLSCLRNRIHFNNTLAYSITLIRYLSFAFGRKKFFNKTRNTNINKTPNKRSMKIGFWNLNNDETAIMLIDSNASPAMRGILKSIG